MPDNTVRINGFYSDDKKTIKSDLFDTTAEAIAGTFTTGRAAVSKRQLRRLYDEVKRFEQKLDGTPETWNAHFPFIKLIESKVSYQVGRAIDKSRSNRDVEDVYRRLGIFVKDGIELVKDEKDYNVFLALFEAVYGFYCEAYGLIPRSLLR
ncbi:MAG: type III-A CRISPR-associated protein Csm2 [Treponema sp.]|nr:type III-A CRISPR-associated protein Csm2 [Treponema sp.]